MKTLEKKTPKARPASKAPKLVSIDKTTRERKIIEHFALPTIMVPKEYAELLAKPGKCARIPNAGVWEGGEESRIRSWNQKRRLSWGVCEARKNELAEILQRTLDTPLTIAMPSADWRRVKVVCKALGITTAEWLLAGVQYAALLAMRDQAEQAASA